MAFPGSRSTKAQRATVQGRTVARHRCNLRQGKRNEAGSGSKGSERGKRKRIKRAEEANRASRQANKAGGEAKEQRSEAEREPNGSRTGRKAFEAKL